MNKRETILAVGFVAAVAVAAALGVLVLYQQGEEIKAVREDLRAQTWESRARLKQLEDQAVTQLNELGRISERLPQPDKEGTPKLAATVPSADGSPKDAKSIQSYPHTADLLAMKPCRAKLVSRNPCTGVFDIGNGQELHLGGPFTSRPIFAFLRSLEKGESVELPAAFIEYLDKGEWTADRAKKAKNVVDEKF